MIPSLRRSFFPLAFLFSVVVHLAVLLLSQAPITPPPPTPPEKLQVQLAVVIPEPEKPPEKPKRPIKKVVMIEESPVEKDPNPEIAAEPKHWEIPQQRRAVRTLPNRQLRPTQVDLSLPPEPRKPDTIPPLWEAENLEPAGVGIATAGTRDPIGNLLPDYPLAMRHAGKPGMVEIGILIDTLGRVEDAVPLLIRGNLKFADVTLRAVKGWEDLPVLRDSSGIKVWYWVRKKFFFGTKEGDPIHNFKGQRRNLHEQVPEETNYGKMLYEHIYNYK